MLRLAVPLGGVLTWLTLRSLPESRDPRPRARPARAGELRRRSFLGVHGLTAVVAFAQSVALYPLFLFLAVYLQEGLAYSATETGLRLLPLTLVLLAVAPISGRLTGHIGLRAPLVTGLVLIAAALLLMRGLEPSSSWTHLLPGFIVGGLAIGVISPALAAAMAGVLSADQVGLASGINNTFRQLGIAVGIAVLGAVFTHPAGGGLPGLVDGLNAVFAAAAAIAAAGAVIAWPLLGGFAPKGHAPSVGCATVPAPVRNNESCYDRVCRHSPDRPPPTAALLRPASIRRSTPTASPRWPRRSAIRCACRSSTSCGAARAPVCQCELIALFEIRQSLLSHHVKRLVDAGLLDVERRHKWAYYSVSADGTKELTAWLS